MKKHAKTLKILMVLAAALLFSFLCWLLREFVPRSSVRYSLLAVAGGIFGFSRDRSFTLQTKYVIRWMP